MIEKDYMSQDEWDAIAGIQEAYQGITVPGLRSPFEKAVTVLKSMLGKKFKVNSYVAIESPDRLEISIQKHGEKINIMFHGDKPKATAMGGWVSPEVTGIVINGNKATVGLSGILPDLTVEFE